MKEYKQIDLMTGEIIETYLLSSLDTIQEDYRETWSNNLILYSPIYDVKNDKWISGISDEKITEQIENDKVPTLETLPEDRLEALEEMLLFLMTDAMSEGDEY